MSSSVFTPLTRATDAPRDRGVKEYRIYDFQSTVGAINTLGYFNRYDLRGANPGDVIRAFGSDGEALLRIGGDDDATGAIQTSIIISNAGIAPTAFTGLIDTPGVLGDPLQILRVNATGDALEFVDDTPPVVSGTLPEVLTQRQRGGSYGGQMSSSLSSLSTAESFNAKGTFTVTNPSSTDPMVIIPVMQGGGASFNNIGNGNPFTLMRRLYFDNGSGIDTMVMQRGHYFPGSSSGRDITDHQAVSFNFNLDTVLVPASGSLTLGIQHGLYYPSAGDEASALANANAATSFYNQNISISLFGMTYDGATVINPL